jgi:hypothetical protein
MFTGRTDSGTQISWRKRFGSLAAEVLWTMHSMDGYMTHTSLRTLLGKN